MSIHELHWELVGVKEITAAFMHSLHSKGSKVRYERSLKLLMNSVENFGSRKLFIGSRNFLGLCHESFSIISFTVGV